MEVDINKNLKEGISELTENFGILMLLNIDRSIVVGCNGSFDCFHIVE